MEKFLAFQMDTQEMAPQPYLIGFILLLFKSTYCARVTLFKLFASVVSLGPQYFNLQPFVKPSLNPLAAPVLYSLLLTQNVGLYRVFS